MALETTGAISRSNLPTTAENNTTGAGDMALETTEATLRSNLPTTAENNAEGDHSDASQQPVPHLVRHASETAPRRSDLHEQDQLRG
eukprot:8220107-Heterocapsa_arctica.AAC.1